MKASVTWFCNVLRIGRRSLDVGYCGAGMGIAYISMHISKNPNIAEFLKPLIVRDVFYNELECEDGRRCFNLKCPLCRPDLAYFRRYGIRSKDELMEVHSFLENIARELALKPAGEPVFLYGRPPLILRRRKRA